MTNWNLPHDFTFQDALKAAKEGDYQNTIAILNRLDDTPQTRKLRAQVESAIANKPTNKLKSTSLLRQRQTQIAQSIDDTDVGTGLIPSAEEPPNTATPINAKNVAPAPSERPYRYGIMLIRHSFSAVAAFTLIAGSLYALNQYEASIFFASLGSALALWWMSAVLTLLQDIAQP